MLKGNASGNLNNIKDGIYAVHSGVSPITNGPSGETLGILLSFSAEGYGNGGNPKIQFYGYAYGSQLKLYCRSCWSGDWTIWDSVV